MTITVHAEARIARPVDVVFALAAGRTANLARFFMGHKPLIPAISSATLVGRDDPRRTMPMGGHMPSPFIGRG